MSMSGTQFRKILNISLVWTFFHFKGNFYNSSLAPISFRGIIETDQKMTAKVYSYWSCYGNNPKMAILLNECIIM